MKKSLIFVGIVLAMACMAAVPPPPPPPPAGDAGAYVAVKMRLYEGFRQGGQGGNKVVSSYFLKPLSSEGVFSDAETDKEKQTLKRVFNLTDVNLMTDAAMLVPMNKRKTPSSVVVLNGRELLVKLSIVAIEQNRFKVEVLDEKRGAAPLLETRIVLPEKKATALGFEDSGGNIYFLSFFRQSKMPSPPPPPAKDANYYKIVPKLIKKVAPKYPEEAVKDLVQGLVLVSALTDMEGNVVEAKAIKGPEPLRGAAAAAVLQWKYEPFIIEGKKESVKFTVVMRFNLDKKKGVKKEPVSVSAKERPELLKKVVPKYPKAALKDRIMGKVVAEVITGADGSVNDVKIVDGIPLLNDAAIEALYQWKFKPFIKDGVPIPIRFTVIVDFNPDKKKK